MNKILKMVLLFLMCAFSIATTLLASEALDEANASFTYQGKPIHPLLLKEFSNWQSDLRPPMITTVDVAASFSTNKYSQYDIKKRDDWIFVEKTGKDKGPLFYESFDYRWLGKTASGVHALETGESGGGSGFFMDLMFVRFSEGEIMWGDKTSKQLLMTIVGTHPLGDRYEGKVEVLSDKVLIHPSPVQRGGGSVEKDIELKFPLE